MIDILLLLVVLAVAWCVASEGAWGAVLICFSVIFSGLLAMNFFEPLAGYVERQLPTSWGSAWASRVDLVVLVGLFGLFVFLFRLATDYIAPTMIELHPLAYQLVRGGFGLLTGYVTMAFLLTALHTAMLPRNFIGFTPERPNFLGMAAPDRQWLGFVQHVSENVFPRRELIRDAETGQILPVKRIFDGLRYRLPDTNPPTYIELPTFAIRYASRREAFASGAASGTTKPGTGGIRSSGDGGSTTAQPAF